MQLHTYSYECDRVDLNSLSLPPFSFSVSSPSFRNYLCPPLQATHCFTQFDKANLTACSLIGSIPFPVWPHPGLYSSSPLTLTKGSCGLFYVRNEKRQQQGKEKKQKANISPLWWDRRAQAGISALQLILRYPFPSAPQHSTQFTCRPWAEAPRGADHLKIPQFTTKR